MKLHSTGEYVRIAALSELPPVGECREFQRANGRLICVANVKGHFVAMDNVCPHLGGTLGQGTVEYGFVVCPWHGWQIDPKTGVAQQDHDCKVDIYDLHIEGDDVLISSVPVR